MIKSLLAKRSFLQKKSPGKSITSWLKNGSISRETATMLEGVINVSNMHVRDIMVSKSMMCTIDPDTPVQEYLAMVIETGHSRFPLIDGSTDKALGIIMAKDILKQTIIQKTQDHEKLDLTSLARPVKVIPESKRLNLLLREFRLSHKHMAVVVNEYGSISGLITIEDVLEQIVGDIIDEFDVSEHSTIDKVAKDKYEMSALTPVEVCNQELGIKLLPHDYDTVGGVVMHAFGRMPKRNEAIEVDGHNIKVISCDHRRIKQIAVTISNDTDDSTSD
jgi:magnesium and cobalt transporter